MIKKILKDTIGISIGGVGIQSANTLGQPWGSVLGSSIASGMNMEILPRRLKK